MRRHLLIDGDVLIYRMGNSAQRTGSFPREKDGQLVHFTYVDEGQCVSEVQRFIDGLLARLEAQSYSIALSDLDASFRYSVYPRYKQSRKNAYRPVIFHRLRELFVERGAAEIWPGLEGDDVLGIWMTVPKFTVVDKGRFVAADEVICCTIDKDLKTVPGLLFDWGKPERGVHRTTAEDAKRAHYLQTIAGDRVDGYPGVPGLGEVRAARLLDEKGARWSTVLEAYKSKGLGPKAALVNARCAYILQHGDYDFEKKEVRLWKPPKGEK